MKQGDKVRIGNGKTIWEVQSMTPTPGKTVLIKSTTPNRAGSGRRARLSRLVPYENLTVVEQ